MATRPTETPQAFAQRLGLQFHDLRLLIRAFTHRSYINEHRDALEDNERLEFLGDAILDFVVGEWLYHHFPEMDEGALTRLRSALVCREQLAAFARQIGLDRAMLLGHGEDANGGRERDTLLSATFEALIGALYLDSGLQAVQQFFFPLLEPAVRYIRQQRLDEDPKSVLQERVQAMGYASPTYNTVRAEGPDHNRRFEVEVLVGNVPWGRGTGPSKREATKNAAREALQRLASGELPPE